MFLTHRDDVADHEKFREHFGCERIIHAGDARGIEVEKKIEGSDPVKLGPDLTVIPVPGHTRGSAALLFRRTLFSGDHLWWSRNRGRLTASRDVCWYSWPEQVRSVRRLADHEFEWVLPGHGERAWFPAQEMRAQLGRLIQAVA